MPFVSSICKCHNFPDHNNGVLLAWSVIYRMHSDGVLVSRVTNAFIAVDVLMSALTVPLALLVLYVLMKDRAYSGSFFTIYKVPVAGWILITIKDAQVGLVYDILSLVSLHILGVIPTRGRWIREEFMESQLYLKVRFDRYLSTIKKIIWQTFYSVSYFTHTCQGATNLILSLNRATAVLLPMYHHKVQLHSKIFHWTMIRSGTTDSFFLLLFSFNSALDFISEKNRCISNCIWCTTLPESGFQWCVISWLDRKSLRYRLRTRLVSVHSGWRHF